MIASRTGPSRSRPTLTISTVLWRTLLTTLSGSLPGCTGSLEPLPGSLDLTRPLVVLKPPDQAVITVERASAAYEVEDENDVQQTTNPDLKDLTLRTCLTLACWRTKPPGQTPHHLHEGPWSCRLAARRLTRPPRCVLSETSLHRMTHEGSLGVS